MLTLLIATGARPEAWEISQTLLQRQTYAGAVRVVVVDDGQEPQSITLEREGWQIDVIRPVPLWLPGNNTQARNLAAGLEVIGDERVAVWEDDDYYSPSWLETVARWLDGADLVGETRARYFNVSTGRGRQLSNTDHASLCATGCKGDGLAALRECVTRRKTYIDLDLWQRFQGRKILRDTKMVVGIKGLPGRGGIGSGHKKDFGVPINLRQWIGEDAALYRR